MALVRSSSEVWMEYQDNFPKQTLRNRYYILTAQGVNHLTVPVQKASNLPSNQVKISYDQNWPKQHAETIAAAYGKSAYWLHYSPMIRHWIETPYTYLQEMQQAALTICLEALGLQVPIRQTDRYYAATDMGEDSPDWCDARDLITKTNFAEMPALNDYRQCFGPSQEAKQGPTLATSVFHPGLSMIDLLFCQGPAAIDFVPKYELWATRST